VFFSEHSVDKQTNVNKRQCIACGWGSFYA